MPLWNRERGLHKWIKPGQIPEIKGIWHGQWLRVQTKPCSVWLLGGWTDTSFWKWFQNPTGKEVAGEEVEMQFWIIFH